MDSRRHAILQRTVGLRAVLSDVAIKHRVSVDELVCAVLGREKCALEAAQEVRTRLPKVESKLLDWPTTCPFCKQDRELTAKCPFCRTQGCSACVTGRGCPPCYSEKVREREGLKALRDTTVEFLERGDL